MHHPADERPSPARTRARASSTEWQTTADRKAAERRDQRRKTRRLVRTGQALMVLAALVALTHLAMHLQVFGAQPSNLLDLVAGYPAAAILGLIGAILAGR